MMGPRISFKNQTYRHNDTMEISSGGFKFVGTAMTRRSNRSRPIKAATKPCPRNPSVCSQTIQVPKSLNFYKDQIILLNMQLRRGHVYGIRTCLPEFVNACISNSESAFPRDQLVNTTIRPCALVSWTGSICQIALFATYGNSPQEQIDSAALRHFSIPISYLSPRHGLTTVDLNRTQATLCDPPTHQYVVACIGSVRVDELCEWTDCAGQHFAALDEGAMRRLEVCTFERLQTWQQIQPQASGMFQTYPIHSGFNPPPVGYVSA